MLWFTATAVDLLFWMLAFWSLSTVVTMSRWARMLSSSPPAVSCMVISFQPAPLTVLDFRPLTSRPNGGMFSSLKTRPVMIGRSGSPSRKSTTTSWPTRGGDTPPMSAPAHGLARRIQQELFSAPLSRRSSLRSQWNCTFTRP